MTGRRALAMLLAALVLAAAGTGCGRKKAVRVRAPRPPASTGGPTVVVGNLEYGFASWYGHPYHGRATSSGEIYNMYAFTAAHRTLPFFTEVEVTNMENGDKVQVRINDRGPFADGRIIDLSLSAAKAIRLVGPGTALVRVKVLRAPSYVAAASRPARGGAWTSPEVTPAPMAATGAPAISSRFTVQVGAFADRRNAERLRAELARRYPHFPVNTAPTPDGSFYRVWVGSEPSEERALLVAERLRSDRITAFVVRLD